MSFRLINEARKLAPPSGSGGIELSGLLFSLLDRGFFSYQMASIRRLVDEYPLESLERKRDVYSLVAIIKDMDEHRALITRENMLAAERIPYDFKWYKQRRDAFVREQLRKGRNSWSISPLHAKADIAAKRHSDIDRLTGSNVARRSPNDTVSGDIFTNMLKHVRNTTRGIRKHVDKFVAHAASPASRRIAHVGETGVTLGHLLRANEVLGRYANFLHAHLLHGSYHVSLMPHAQFNVLKYMERPLAPTHIAPKLHEAWLAFEEEAETWAHFSIDDILGFR